MYKRFAKLVGWNNQAKKSKEKKDRMGRNLNQRCWEREINTFPPSRVSDTVEYSRRIPSSASSHGLVWEYLLRALRVSLPT